MPRDQEALGPKLPYLDLRKCKPELAEENICYLPAKAGDTSSALPQFVAFSITPDCTETNGNWSSVAKYVIRLDQILANSPLTAGTSSHPELQCGDGGKQSMAPVILGKKKNPCRIPCIFQLAYAIIDQSQYPACWQIICCNGKNPCNLGISWKYFLWSQ